MGIHRPEQEHDDQLEIEVGPLKWPSAAEPTAATGDVRPLFFSTRSRAQRLRRGAVVTAALFAALVALTLVYLPAREDLRGLIFGPTPTATASIPFGEDNFYIALSPSWGNVSLDGRTLSHLPAEGIDQPLHLGRGSHEVRWRFPPVIEYRCRLSVPTALDDTCPLLVGTLPQKKGIASVVYLRLTLEYIPSGIRDALLNTLQTALDVQQSSEVVRPGERYVDTSHLGTPAVATQPIRATLRFLLNHDEPTTACPALQSGQGVNCVLDGQDCRQICSAPWVRAPSSHSGGSNPSWSVLVVAYPSWRYATLEGQVVANYQPDIGANLQFLGNDEHLVPMTISWDGATWHARTAFDVGGVGGPLGDPGCATAADEVAFAPINPPGPNPGDVRWLYVVGQPRAEGCLAAAVLIDSQGVPVPGSQGQQLIGLVLHRFGVALAANDAAHRYWPWLPVADAHEQGIAQKLAQTPPGVVGAG